MNPANEPADRWQIWVDTGGTFTDCLAIDPGGRLHRAKVLSTSALRGTVAVLDSDKSLIYEASWQLPRGFANGAELHWLEQAAPSAEIVASDERRLRLSTSLPASLAGQAFEIRFAEEAPVVAARWVTATPAGAALPALAMRLATTRGTNALLERRGARTAFFVTRGFADLLVIGNQQRPDLFALDIRRPAPLYHRVFEVAERLAADGSVLETFDVEPLAPLVDALLADGVDSAAIAFLHSYLNPRHEQQLAAFLAERGVRHVSVSSRLASQIKILPRAETAVVNAYLAPIIEDYLASVTAALGESSQLHVMTSAGGLVRRRGFEPKDSLLSGPAGGVVGAARSGRACGYERLIAFDMGGTSTDVARFDGDYEYLFEHRVGDALVAAPALAIESVAAGGGSVCWHDGRQLKVGPQSAGARPGPACYGAGGPLTLTDVHLLLGRLDPRWFGIPIVTAAATAASQRLAAELETSGAAEAHSTLSRDALLCGFLEIADERMADAVRRISIRRGYDPRDYALVAFGGAGGLHACAVAELLAITTVILPRDAGLLSALGLGTAVVERFAQRQVLAPYEEVAASLPRWLEELASQANDAVVAEGVAKGEIDVRRRLAFLRFVGQETAVEVDVPAATSDLVDEFLRRYQAIYGYRPASRQIEVESLRVIASSRPAAATAAEPATAARPARPLSHCRAYFAPSWRRVPTYDMKTLSVGDHLAGPALVFDDHASLVVGERWLGDMSPSGALVLRC